MGKVLNLVKPLKKVKTTENKNHKNVFICMISVENICGLWKTIFVQYL